MRRDFPQYATIDIRRKAAAGKRSSAEHGAEERREAVVMDRVAVGAQRAGTVPHGRRSVIGMETLTADVRPACRCEVSGISVCRFVDTARRRRIERIQGCASGSARSAFDMKRACDGFWFVRGRRPGDGREGCTQICGGGDGDGGAQKGGLHGYSPIYTGL